MLTDVPVSLPDYLGCAGSGCKFAMACFPMGCALIDNRCGILLKVFESSGNQIDCVVFVHVGMSAWLVHLKIGARRNIHMQRLSQYSNSAVY